MDGFTPDSTDAIDFGMDPTPAESPTEIAQPAIDPAEFQRVQERLQAQEQFQRAFQQALGAAQPNAAAPVDPANQFLDQFVKDPQQVLAEQVAQVIKQQQAIQQLDAEYSAKYPHLAQPGLKEAVMDEAYRLAEAAHRAGKPIDDRAAIDQAVAAWNGRIDALIQARTQAQQTDALKQAALPFTVPATGQPVTNGPPDLFAMNNRDFAQYRDQRLRQLGITPS